MEVKILKPQSPSSSDLANPPFNSKHDSRGMRIIHYLTRSVSGNSLNDQTSSREMAPSRPHDVSDSEDSDEDVHTSAGHSNNSSTTDTARPGLLQRLADKLSKAEPPHNDVEEKAHQIYAWGMSKSVLEVSKGVAADIKGSLLQMKSVLIEKLASMPTIPAETLEHARHSIESIISDATHSAYGKTRDAMSKIRLKLVEIIPSLSPHESKKLVDDVEREVLDMSKATNGDKSPSQKLKDEGKDSRVGVSASTVSAVMADQQPVVPSGLVANVDRLRSWALRSRL